MFIFLIRKNIHDRYSLSKECISCFFKNKSFLAVNLHIVIDVSNAEKMINARKNQSKNVHQFFFHICDKNRRIL
jgi:hypothetical protein